MSTELATREDSIIQSFDDVNRVGKAMAASGYFDDAKDAAKAIVKIMAGRELGFGPFAAMNGIHIIQGKPSVGANLMAAAVKGHPSYDYHVDTLTDQECAITFYQGGEPIGESVFTMQDARETKYYNKGSWQPLAGKHNWRNYPRNMLFARAISNGVRWYCPDVFAGNAVYTPDELDDEAPAPGWDVVNGEVEEAEPEPQPESQSKPEKPPVAPGDAESDGGNGSKAKATKTRTGPQEYWHVYHNDGPKDAGVAMSYARNIAKKYGDDGNDWGKAISRLRDAEVEAKEGESTSD